MTAPRPILLLDAMDTLIVDPVFERLPPLLGLELAEIWRRKDPGAWPAFERGHIDEAAYFARFFKDGETVDGDAIREAMNEGYQWVPGMQTLLEELQTQGAVMHILSNYPVWYELIEAKLGPGRYAPWTFVSARTGRRKPEAEAYTEAAAALGVAPAACLFIDDRAKNCQAARAVGMPAALFQGAADLRRALIEEGFPLAAEDGA